MEAVTPQRFAESGSIFRRRLLLEELPSPKRQGPSGGPRSRGLQVLMDGFLHGSMLTLAVCTPQRSSLFSRNTARRREVFRAFLVSKPAAEPVEETQGPAVPVAR